MSCGNPHETPCAEVIDHLYEFIDGELPDALRAKVLLKIEQVRVQITQVDLD